MKSWTWRRKSSQWRLCLCLSHTNMLCWPTEICWVWKCLLYASASGQQTCFPPLMWTHSYSYLYRFGCWCEQALILTGGMLLREFTAGFLSHTLPILHLWHIRSSYVQNWWSVLKEHICFERETLHQSWSNGLTAQVWFVQWDRLFWQPMTFIMNFHPEGIFTRSVVHSAPLTPNTRARENYEPLSIYTREKSIRQQVEGLLGTDSGLKLSLRRLYWPKSHTHSRIQSAGH